MKSLKELKALLEAEKELIEQARERAKDLQTQIYRLESGFQEGDIVEWMDGGKPVRGQVFDMSEWCPRAYQLKKDGSVGTFIRNVYQGKKVNP